MSYDEVEKPEEDDEKNVYLMLSLSKYPFLKNIKVGEEGSAKFKGEIETSENQDEDCVHHTIVFQDLNSANPGRRK